MNWHIPDIDITCLVYAYEEVMRWLQVNIPTILLITNAVASLKVWAYASAKVPDNKIRTLLKVYSGVQKLFSWMKKKDVNIFNIDETIPEGKLLGIAIYKLMCSGDDKFKAPDDILEILKTDLQQAEEYWRKIHGKEN